MNRALLAIVLGMTGGCERSQQEPDLMITAPAGIQRGLELGVFKDLRARLTVGTMDNANRSPDAFPETPVDGCPFNDEVELQTDGSFSVQCAVQSYAGNLFAAVAYEEDGYIDLSHPDPLILVEKQRQVQFSGGNNATVSFDDAAASTNIRGSDRYDSNQNGVSNLGDILQGWDPQAAGLAWVLKLDGIPSSANPGYNSLFKLALLPPNGDQMFLNLQAGSGSSGDLKYMAIVDMLSPTTLLWSSTTESFPTIDASGLRVLMSRCDGTGPSSQCYLDSVGFSGGGYTSVATSLWDQTFNWAQSAPAVEASGTTWLMVRDNMNNGALALMRVAADLSTVSGLLPISGIGVGPMSCFFGPKFDNHWIINSTPAPTLYAFYQASQNNCGSTLSDGDVQLVGISLGASPVAGSPLTLRGVGCSSGSPRVAIDTVGGTIYAATKNDLSAYALDGTKKWTSPPVDLTAQHCSASSFTAQNTSIPFVTSTGDVLVIFGGCEVFAYASQGEVLVPQAPKWHREFHNNNPYNQGMGRGDADFTEALGNGHVALASVYPDDPGAASGYTGGNGIQLTPPIGGIAIDLAAASAESAAVTGFFAQTPQYANSMNPQVSAQYQPKSDVLAVSGTIYFATDVFSTPAGAPQLACVSPPCYYLIAAKNTPAPP